MDILNLDYNEKILINNLELFDEFLNSYLIITDKNIVCVINEKDIIKYPFEQINFYDKSFIKLKIEEEFNVLFFSFNGEIVKFKTKVNLEKWINKANFIILDYKNKYGSNIKEKKVKRCKICGFDFDMNTNYCYNCGVELE